MSKERVAFESLNNRGNAVVAPNTQIVALGNIVSEDNPEVYY